MTLPASVTSACRVTVVTPQARVDVALPLGSTLVELIPQLIRLSGAESLAQADNPGWVLSRLGGAPMPLGLTITAAGIRDGDVLYLNPKERRMAPLLFDDVVDAIANAAENRDGAWGPKAAYRAGMAGAAVVLVGAAFLLLRGMWASPFASVGVAALAVLLLVGGGALARAYGDADAGAVCALVGVPVAGLAGLLVFGSHTLALGTAEVATALAAITVYGALAVVVVAYRLPWFLGVTVAALLGALAAAVPLIADVAAQGSAAIAVALATALAAVAPMLSLRLAKLPLPTVPTDMDSFREKEKPTLGPSVLDQTAQAEALLAGLLSAFGLVLLGGVVVLLRGDNVAQAGLVGVVGVVWLLRSRSYSGTLPRVVFVVAGLAVLACLGAWLALSTQREAMLIGAGVLAVSGLICVSYAKRAVRGKQSPYWSRLLDVAEFLGLIAIIPLAGEVVGLYAALRGAL
jgi:type VII secretion integral membrane protein EccD